jgi:hypothetical protein
MQVLAKRLANNLHIEEQAEYEIACSLYRILYNDH